MKKILVIALAIVTIVTLTIPCFANVFVQSPSLNMKVRRISFRFEAEGDCDGELIVTAFVDRDQLPEDEKVQLNDAYDEIKAATDLTTFTDELKALAEEQNIPASDLAARDLFDIRFEGCQNEDHLTNGHGKFTITLADEYLKGFVGLLHRHEGEYDLIENATVNGNEITFEVKEFSPFAIVVNTNNSNDSTSDSIALYIWASVAVVSAVALVVVLVKAKKQKAE